MEQCTVPFDPSSGAMLSIASTTVTRRLEHTITTSAHIEPLRKYLCSRFSWTHTTFWNIDWPSFNSVYSKYPRAQTFFTKFGWKKLPVGKRLHSREKRYNDRCPDCLLPAETDDHLVQCHHPSRHQWRTEFFVRLSTTFGSFLDPELLALIRIGLAAYFAESPPPVAHKVPSQPLLRPLPTAHHRPD